MDLRHRRLRLSRFAIRPPGAAAGVMMHSRLQSVVDVGADGLDLLRRFASPTAPSALADLVAGDVDALLAVIAELVAAGILVGEDEEEDLRRGGRAGWEAQQALLVAADAPLFGGGIDAAEAELRLVGVPFDGAGVSGPAAAPGALRQLGAQSWPFIDPLSGAFRGVRDQSCGRVLLEGARVCDHGDVNFAPWDERAAAFERIRRAAAWVASLGGTPVFVGGDHSITEPLLRGCAREPVFVVHLDAHTDIDTDFAGAAHHHGNVMERLRRSQLVRGILQIGVRDLAPPWWRSPDRVRQIGARELAWLTAAEVVARVPEGIPCYLTVDIDVVDPAEAPGTGCPVPGGPRLDRVVEIVEELIAARPVIGVDLVELAPHLDPRGLTTAAAAHLLLRMLDALRRR